MSHFAKVENGIVTQVIVAEQDVIDSGLFGTGWVQTSYNTSAGQHPEGRPLRKNYAGIGFTYDANRDAFIPPKPFNSWTLNEDTCLWDCPVAYPTDGAVYVWNEGILNWVLFENLTPVIQEPVAAPVIQEPVVAPVIQEPVIIDTIVVDLGSNSADSIMGGADSIIGGV